MSRDEDKLIRQLSLLSFLLSAPRPFTAREIQESVEGYWGMSDDTFTRRFNGDRHDLEKVGIEIRVLTGSDAADAGEAQLYLLRQEDFRLPEAGFTPEELTALSMALAALDGRFAYARPLRLALTAICHGRQDELDGAVRASPGGAGARRGRAQGRQAAGAPGGRRRPRPDRLLSPTHRATPTPAAGADRRPVQPVPHPRGTGTWWAGTICATPSERSA